MWWLFSSALAQTTVTIDSAEIRQMVAELYPRVARHLGREPVGTLRSGILSRERVRAAVDAPAPTIGARAPASENRVAADRMGQRVAADLRIAVYVGQLQGIYVVREAVNELFAEEGLAPGQLRPLLRCLLVHELVHAVQHVYGTVPTEGDADTLDGWTALREGHATAVELELCAAWEGPEIARRVATIHGLDATGSLDPARPETMYAYGRALASVLEREDPDLVWAALGAPPPRWSALVRDLRPILGGGWEDPGAVVAALRTLGVSGAEPRPGGLQAVGPLWGDPGGFGLPAATAGWLAEGPGGVVAVYRTAEPHVAAGLVAKREAGTASSGAFLVGPRPFDGPVEIGRGPLPALARQEGVEATLRVDLSTKSGVVYRERWLATEHVLALVVTRGGGGGRTSAAADDALAALGDALPRGPVRSPVAADLTSLAGWLDRVRARRSSVEATPDPQWRLLEAALAWQRGEQAPCGPAFDDALVPGALRHPEAWARTAYDCAAAANETATADRAAALLGPLPAISAAVHARALVESGRLDDALAILDRATGADAVERRALADTRMHALGAAKRWDELLAVASLAEGSPGMRVQVAVVLRRLGRTAEATHLFAAACFTGEGPPPDACGPER